MAVGGQYDSGITGIVSGGRVLLFVRRLIFFIHNDQSQILVGEEQGGTCAEDNGVWLFGELLFPYFQSFVVRVFGMLDPQLVSEKEFEPFRNLGCQCYFWQEVEYLLTLFKLLLDEMDVYFCFSTGSDTM